MLRYSSVDWCGGGTWDGRRQILERIGFGGWGAWRSGLGAPEPDVPQELDEPKESTDEETESSSSSEDETDDDESGVWCKRLVRRKEHRKLITYGVSKEDGKVYTVVNGLCQGELVPDFEL